MKLMNIIPHVIVASLVLVGLMEVYFQYKKRKERKKLNLLVKKLKDSIPVKSNTEEVKLPSKLRKLKNPKVKKHLKRKK